MNELLLAVAQFLEEDVRPALKSDKGLAFRTLIAANLCRVACLETVMREGHTEAERARLRALLPDLEQPGEDREAFIIRAREELSREIRTEELSDDRFEALFAYARESLVEKLQVVNPRFNPSPDIERGR